MTPDRLICVTTGSPGEQKTSFRLLSDEVDKFMEAMARATEQGKPQEVKVGDQTYKIEDPKKAGRIVKPVTD